MPNEELENIRIGYRAAIDLWIAQGNQNWSRFNAMLVANSVIVAVIVQIARGDYPLLDWRLQLALPVVGLIVCWSWLAAVSRGMTYQDHYVAKALDLEAHLGTVNVVQGGHALLMAGFARIRTRTAMYTVVVLFVLLYLAAIVTIVRNHCG